MSGHEFVVVNHPEGQRIVCLFLDLFLPCSLLPHFLLVHWLVGGVQGRLE